MAEETGQPGVREATHERRAGGDRRTGRAPGGRARRRRGRREPGGGQPAGRQPAGRADRRGPGPVDRHAHRPGRPQHAAVLQGPPGRDPRPGRRRPGRAGPVLPHRVDPADPAVPRRGPAGRRDPPGAGHLPQGPGAAGGARHPGRLPGHRDGPLGRAVPRAGRAGAAARPDHHPDPGPARRLRSGSGRRGRGQPGAAAQAGQRVRRGHRGTRGRARRPARSGRCSRAADAAEVPGFEIADRQVIGTFTYAKLPMVRDLQAAGELLGDSDVVAAIAGDIEAQELLSTATDGGRAGARLAGGGLLGAGRRLLAAQRDRRGAVRAQPGDPRTAGHRQEPDHRQPDRRAGRPRPEGAVRRREAGRHRRGAVPAQGRRPGRGGARHPRGHQGPAAHRPRPRRHAGPGAAARRRRRSPTCTGGWSTGSGG